MQKQNLPNVFVVILNYNGGKVLNNCINSVFQSNYPNFQIVIVDNNSTDASFENARLRYPQIHFIKNPENFGFAKGNNIGIRFALEKFADFIFILNNDAIIKSDTIFKLIKRAKSLAKPAILSPLIFDKKNSIWFSGGKINWLKMKAFHHNDKLQKKKFPNTDYLTGCAMLIDAAIFKKVGLFNEKYFLYYEDADFSYRATSNGFVLFIDTDIKIQHLEQSNTENKNKLYWLVLSGLIFFTDNSKGFLKLWIFIYIKIRKLKNYFDFFILKKTSSSQIKKAFSDFKKIK